MNSPAFLAFAAVFFRPVSVILGGAIGAAIGATAGIFTTFYGVVRDESK